MWASALGLEVRGKGYLAPGNGRLLSQPFVTLSTAKALEPDNNDGEVQQT
jgi:hypothetical protein